MKSNDEMAHNSMLLRKCNKAYNTVTTIYAVICAFYAAVTLFIMFLGQTNSPFFAFLDGVILKGALFACGFLACYKHDTKFTLFALASVTINILVKGGLNGIICVIAIILSALTAVVNKQYHWLENQFGFPYFSERFEEQNIDARQRDIKDEYQQNYERYMKNSSSDMNDIDSAVPSIDLTEKSDSVQADSMDDI